MHRAVVGALALIAAIALAIVLRSEPGSDHGRQLALYGAMARHAVKSEGGSRHGAEESESAGGEDRDAKKAAPEIKGGKGGEADRHGARTPWGEQVGNRAYPRSYVDDRIATRVRRAFERIPARASRSSFRSSGAYGRSLAAAPDAWSPIGPVTPNVSGEASQFFDPVTQKGPETQESGRQTAVAVDPACVPGNCRVWVASAGGGIWSTADALADNPLWTPPPADLDTNTFGSLLYDAAHQTLYAGSGEQNGSGDSEAGLGLYKSTDFGASWSLVGPPELDKKGSRAVAINRSIGSIAVDPANANTIYIGTALARHGSASVNGGRRTPPDAPRLGVYKSTDGGENFTLQEQLSDKTPQNPTDPAEGTGIDWFQGGVNKLEFDPNDPSKLYAAVIGYGLWRSADGGANWTQVYHTFNQTDFDDPDDPGDSTGDRTEFDLVDTGTTTRAYLGDSSDDQGKSRVFRANDVAGLAGEPTGAYDNTGWQELSSSTNGTNGFAAYNWCQGQCGYDAFVVSPPGHPGEVWLGGSMNYDELPAYAGQPPRSNGRGVIRTTNGGATAPTDVTWQDMTVQLGSDDAWDPVAGLHPDQHAVGFSQDGSVAFVSSDGGLARVDVGDTEDHSGSCDNRQYVYDEDPEPLNDADLRDCQELLSAIPSAVKPLNDGLADLQFQSLSVNPKNQGGELLGGTQDNGTWSFTGTPAWFESVGGDGGQSGFNAGDPAVRFHNYFDATPEVNFHGNDSKSWLNIYDRLQETGEARSFYTPFVADPVTPGRLFTGLEHVWRAEDNGGKEADLFPQCLSQKLDPNRSACGNWEPIGQNLTGGFGGDRSGQYVVATERAPGDAGTLWAATRTGRVFISKNADAKANRVRYFRIDDDAGTPERFVSGISVDPANPNHAWISYTGYSAYTPSTPGHVFEVTYDPAAKDSTWVDQSGNLDDEPITDIAYNGATGDVYASSDFGVLRLPNGSAEWTQAAADMPAVAVYGLTIAECDGYLYAATHGRSAYVLKLPANEGVPCKAPAAAPSSNPTPAPTTTPSAPAPDKTKPTLTVRKVKTVHRPSRSTLRGRATDKGGIRSVKIRWGDGKRTTAKLSRLGRFTARHRYKKAKRFTVRVTAADKAGNTRSRTLHAKVLKKRTGGA
jgi:hypothetical protein